MAAPEARHWQAEDLRVGLSAEFVREIGTQDVMHFADVSGDSNPLHVSHEYAGTTNFGRPIVHGAFQVGLASAMIGMYLPGRSVLLGSVSARFGAPLYYPCQVVVRGEISAWNPATRGGQLRVSVREQRNQVPTADVVMAFTLHQAQPQAKAAITSPRMPDANTSSTLDAVLVTGAAGGLGAELVTQLAQQYAVIALVNREPLAWALRSLANVTELRADLTHGDLGAALRQLLGGRPLYGIVHAAWPGAPLGGLLDTPDEVIEKQLSFGGTHLVRLARVLYAQAAPARGGRFVAIGSIVGSQKPTLALAAYALGKNALEASVRMLAPELARRQVTINALCPSFVPVGINHQANDRQQRLEMARVPLGRLCRPDDVVAAVQYLLSAGSGFVSGQVLGLTGGQL